MPTAILSMQLNNRISTLLLSFLTMGMLSCSSVESLDGGGTNVMKMGLSKNDSPGKIRLELENVSNADLLVLMWNIPTAEGDVESDVFEVNECSGPAVFYTGKMVSRIGISADDVLQLSPGEKVTRSINLANFYDLKNVNCYTVRYNSCLQYRAFNSVEALSEFLKKSGSSLSVEDLSLTDCMESNVLKFEG